MGKLLGTEFPQESSAPLQNRAWGEAGSSEPAFPWHCSLALGVRFYNKVGTICLVRFQERTV